MTSFIEQMTWLREMALNPKSMPISNMGIPNLDRRSLVLRSRTRPTNDANYRGNGFTFIQVSPDPIINELDPNVEPIVRLPAIQGGLKIFEVKGIPARYPRRLLEHESIEYIVDGKLTDNGTGVFDIFEGTLCHLQGIRQNATTWDLVLQQPIGEQQLWLVGDEIEDLFLELKSSSTFPPENEPKCVKYYDLVLVHSWVENDFYKYLLECRTDLQIAEIGRFRDKNTNTTVQPFIYPSSVYAGLNNQGIPVIADSEFKGNFVIEITSDCPLLDLDVEVSVIA